MILITGGYGQLGSDIALECQKRDIACLPVGMDDFDITSYDQVVLYLKMHPTSAIMHCAAYTAVDQAEDDKELCYKVNVDGTRNMAKVAKELSIPLLYVSTDYVFDGEKPGFYDVNDPSNPQSVYGESKWEGEQVVRSLVKDHYIVRISWVFGFNGKNFVRTMLRLGKERSDVSVVSDQVGSPTYTKDAAKSMLDILLSQQYGTYHVTNEGFTSWANFAQYIFQKAGFTTQVHPILSKDYPVKAKRPKNSCLSKQSLLSNGFDLLPTWQDAVDRFIFELKENGEL